jgi:hypothetical protein
MPGLYDDDDDRLSKRTRGESRSELTEIVDMLGRRIGGAILVAGLAIGFGVYAGGGGDVEAQKYQAFTADGEVFRVNTESGTVIACSATQPCRIILQRGQDLAEEQNNTLFKAPAAAPLPAPAAAPAAAPAPAALPTPAPVGQEKAE